MMNEFSPLLTIANSKTTLTELIRARKVSNNHYSFFTNVYDIELRCANGPSEQINFFTSDVTVRKERDPHGQKVLPMNQSWNSKIRVSKVTNKQGSHHTYENIFTTDPRKFDNRRTQNLIEGENKGRNYNPVTNTFHYNVKVKGNLK